MTVFFKGFSTIGKNFGGYTLTEHELIKRDLYNNFSIKKGEKLMNPEFGTIIWHMLFEPLTESTSNLIVEDVKQIINNDPRVELMDISLTEYDHGIRVEATIRYVSFNTVETLSLGFDTASGLSTS